MSSEHACLSLPVWILILLSCPHFPQSYLVLLRWINDSFQVTFQPTVNSSVLSDSGCVPNHRWLRGSSARPHSAESHGAEWLWSVYSLNTLCLDCVNRHGEWHHSLAGTLDRVNGERTQKDSMPSLLTLLPEFSCDVTCQVASCASHAALLDCSPVFPSRWTVSLWNWQPKPPLSLKLLFSDYSTPPFTLKVKKLLCFPF